MKPEELRIGNYVYEMNRQTEIHFPYDYPLKIVSIEIGYIRAILPEENLAHIANPIKIKWSNITGVPLTEDWLIKFGFEKEIESKITYFIIDEFNIEWWSKAKDGKALFTDGNLYRHMDFVHQLQNLYFALTGKELVNETIKA